MKIIPWTESWKNERINRKDIDPMTICQFGIKPLDDALIGILKKDFIVIGADSGVGKSELCLKIALHNARYGKKVALYFIEGGDEEAIARIKWDLIRDMYYSEGHNTVEMDYRKWRMNILQSELIDKIEERCEKELKEKIRDNLKIYSFENNFSINDLTESLGYFLKPQGDPQDLLNYKHEVDLIIIDHLQYFTLTNPKNEITEQTEILKKVNEITIHHKIPVILISHLRKKDKERGLPSQEDFYGTSNIAKIASVAITVASGAIDDNYPDLYPTYFRFVKTRTKISSSYALKCNFDFIKGQYEKNYLVHKITMDKVSDEPLKNHLLPRWAARNENQ